MRSFPADFISEGLDQTRGWFYTLLILGTHLFGEAPWKNLIVTGLVLAADGKKMSKSLRNFPDPSIVIDKYGADAVRLYLINSPIVRAENLRFREEGVKDIIASVFCRGSTVSASCLRKLFCSRKIRALTLCITRMRSRSTT